MKPSKNNKRCEGGRRKKEKKTKASVEAGLTKVCLRQRERERYGF
jgi:hypothetical protein